MTPFFLLQDKILPPEINAATKHEALLCLPSML